MFPVYLILRTNWFCVELLCFVRRSEHRQMCLQTNKINIKDVYNKTRLFSRFEKHDSSNEYKNKI